MRKNVALLVVALVAAASVYAGSTGTTALHTPQGSTAATSNGDYVAAASGGLSSSYRYFVEVPAGISRLQIELFDADFGTGGGGEANAGRDRQRVSYGTATYSLFDPSGVSQAVRFTTGNTILPAGGDNAWLTFYDATGNFVRDAFGTAAYSNNDGNNNWSGDWVETDDGGSVATGGSIRIVGGELRLQDNVTGTPNIYREADLLGSPGLGLTAAYLTFDYRTSNNLENGDQISVQVSGNGGGSWTTLQTFSNDSSGSPSYDISAFIANNTRIRFLLAGGFGGTEFFFVDNVQITDGPLTAGHWELRVLNTGGDGINAIGIRAHDGNSGAGGTELNVYADSMVSLGANPNPGANSRSYVHYPWITSGCAGSQNDFDRDTNRGNTGSVAYTSRTGAFTQTFTSATLSADNAWNRDNFSGWTTDQDSVDYGVWTLGSSINTYTAGAVNGNYETAWIGNYAAAANPPSANPQANAFRIYLPTDAGAAPAKPYLEQMLRHNRDYSGPNPPAVGQQTTFTVTVRVTNPTAHAITFSTPSNLVTANVPGAGVVYGGQVGSPSQGSIVSQPSVGGTGNITWNPGTLAAGATALMAYDVLVTPAGAGRLIVTATPASGNGTRAQFVDETGNTTQARATYLMGGICELAVSTLLATPVLVSSFETESRGGATNVLWTTASEAGTIGFNVYRANGEKVNRALIPASLRPDGGTYEVLDRGNLDTEPGYIIEEVTSGGQFNRHGPLVRLKGIDRKALRGRAEDDRQARIALSGVRPDTGPGNAKAEKMAAVMVGVKPAGIVRVLASQLAEVLEEKEKDVVKALTRGGVSVTNQGKKIAWTTDGESLLFFGERSASIYSSENVYRVALDSGGVVMKSEPAPGDQVPVSAHKTSLDIETDAFAATVLPLDPESDYWFWSFVLSGDATYGRATFHVDVPSVAPAGAATLEVRLQGAFKDAIHGARIWMNGVPIGDTSWQSFDAKKVTLGVPAGVLRDGANEVVVEGILANGAGFDVFYVDGFRFEYERFAIPQNGQLELTARGAIGAGPFQKVPMILNVTNRLRPAIITGAAMQNGVSSLTLRSNTTVFFAEDFVAPSSLRGTPEVKLQEKKLAADWVVIAPESMTSGAEALAALRRRDGLVPYVVSLQQIYDSFAGGNVTPHAIKEFIQWTQSWNRKPRYVALAGTGTTDYRGIVNAPGALPPLMISTSGGLFASDSLYADFNGDRLPDLAIGRIPVASNDELLAYVDKLSRNSSRSVSTSPVVFSADAADAGTSFTAASNEAEVAFGTRPVQRIHIDQAGAAGARSALLAAWQSGTPLVSWIGHGGLDQMSSSGLLTSYDMPLLGSAGPLPVLVAMTCTINRFENGFVDPLGVALTREIDGGALAVWSASGLSRHSEARLIQRTFMRLAAQTPGARLGDLIVQSLAQHATGTSSIYLLLGDPALRLALPAEMSSTGLPSAGGE